jgi:hypothetical protein
LENLTALEEHGIASTPKTVELCKLAHVTPAYIHGQAARLHKEGRFATGLLVTILRCNDPLPQNKNNLDRHRYTCGQFSAYVQC